MQRLEKLENAEKKIYIKEISIMAIKSIIINPGSTSTKIGVFEDET